MDSEPMTLTSPLRRKRYFVNLQACLDFNMTGQKSCNLCEVPSDAKKFRCPVPSKAEVDTCLKTDRCCSPEPVFEDTCFRGCKENCESEYSFYGCSNTCPPPPKENLKDCVNYDPLCSIHFMSIDVEDLNRCRFNDPPDLTSCIIRDPCCFVTPVFESGCFTGCRVACHNSLDCERACPVLTEYDVQNCVNTDNHCFVEKLWEEIGGRKCFKGCVKACT
uniref:Uncharacterized protein n=1 Tax=Magallana gigas TaxID=29159 RepID=K1RCL0_MAGGI